MPETHELIEALRAVLSYLYEEVTDYRLLHGHDPHHIGRHLEVIAAFIEELSASDDVATAH